MIAVEEAIARITAALPLMDIETTGIADAAGRVAAMDILARMAQPPAAVSAMDGYALRCTDGSEGARLRVIGSAPAGRPFAGKVGPGQAVRIFTGGVVPERADTIVIQENTEAQDGAVRLTAAAEPDRHIRRAGLDFARGTVLAAAGTRLTARHLSLIAAGDIAEIAVRRRPRIAIAATGDELTLPGAPKPPGAIVASSGYGLSAYVRSWGGEPVSLGIVPDRPDAIAALPERARGADLLVTLGGASVGEHDLIQKALGPQGLAVDFWKIAMRPGKPLLFGRIGDLPLLGLPGNPVSTLVCALLYLQPAIAALLGTASQQRIATAKATTALKANDTRQDYIRATLDWSDGTPAATPLPIQDSSMLSAFARADGLIVRPPHAPELPAGASVPVLLL